MAFAIRKSGRQIEGQDVYGAQVIDEVMKKSPRL
jgi:hypothetical protein